MAKVATASKKGQLNKYDAELAALAQSSAVAEESALGGGAFISTKGGRLSFGGAQVPGDKMNVIIIASVLENVFYNEAYDPESPSSPVCYAFGDDEKLLAPHEKATEPQHEKCKGCPQNEWGSADRGKGKACANVRRLACIPEAALDDVEGAEVAYLKVAVMSVKNWAGYVNQLATTLKRPPFAVVTELSLVPDPKSQFRIQFKLVREITDGATIGELIAKNKVERERITFPYQEVEREEKPAKSRAAKAQPKKQAPAKKSAAPAKAQPKKPIKGQRR